MRAFRLEATDQAALQPNKVDPSAAAQQVAKAIEQAQEAADKANEAAKQLDPMAGEQPMNNAAQDIATSTTARRAKSQIPRRAKSQIPDPKSQPNPKSQNPNQILTPNPQ